MLPQDRTEFFKSVLKQTLALIMEDIYTFFDQEINPPPTNITVVPDFLDYGLVIRETESSPKFSDVGLFVPYGTIKAGDLKIYLFLEQDTMPIPGDKDEKRLPGPGFYMGFHGTTPENSALHAKLADPKLSLADLKQIWYESPRRDRRALDHRVG